MIPEKIRIIEQLMAELRGHVEATRGALEAEGDDGFAAALEDLRDDIDEYAERFEHEDAQRDPLGDDEPVPVAEAEPEVGAYGGGILDITRETERGKVKWYKNRTSKKRGVCVHMIQVRGGMSPHASRIEHWERVEKLPDRWAYFGGPERLAEFAAYADRCRGIPALKYNQGLAYHVISGKPGIVFNHPFERVTWQGDRSNTDFFGYAVDLHFTEALDVNLERSRLEYAIEEARRRGHDIEELTAHGAWTRKPDDPGMVYMRDVALPVAEELSLTVDLDFTSPGPGRTSIREMLKR